MALAHIDKAMGGMETAEVSVRWHPRLSAESPEIGEVVAAVDDVLRQEPLIGNPLSIRNLIDALPGEGETSTRMSLLELLPPPLKRAYFRPESRYAKVGFRIQDIGIASYGPVFERIEQQLASIQQAHPNFRLTLTGNAVARWKNLYQIVVDLAFSLGTASLIIFGVLAIVYRSWRLGLISVVPNIFPLAATGFLLWVTGQSLEIVSVCAFTVCLGIAVDDTIHFLTRFQELDDATVSRKEVIRRAFISVGTALIMTTVVLVIGFSTALLSDSRDHRIFAMMGVLTISTALFGDLIFLPALCCATVESGSRPRRPKADLRQLERANSMETKAIKPASSWMATLLSHCEQLNSQWIAMRRHLHQNPELSDGEFLTTEYLSAELAKLGLPTHVPGEGRGVTADLVSHGESVDSKRIAIRGDIDALPIADAKTVDYRSRCDGVMHACGHDVHATIVFGAMQLLAAMNAEHSLPWPIAVRAILQPSEELATGARHMIHHHALREVDAILALHVDPTRAVGCVGLRHGTLTASCDAVHVHFTGKGGHGARPQLANDPIDAATHWVQAAFRRLGRTVDPHATVVFSVGHFEAGHSANVIPDTARLSGTLRSLDQESRKAAWETLEDVSEAIERETHVRVEMTMGSSAPAVVNDGQLVDLLADSAADALSPAAIQWIDQPSMGSEDFSYYLDLVPGAMFRLGVAGDQVGHAPLHTSTFDIDQHAIAVGCKLFAAAVIKYFDPARA